jgi:16S rRNA (adenine1518-N6/adenine1519-N6)-dimethyltransferase
VTSAVVTLNPRPLPLAAASFSTLERVTAAAFGQRRKMLRGSLKSLGIDPAAVGIDPTRRAEQLTVEELCALARLLAAVGHDAE